MGSQLSAFMMVIAALFVGSSAIAQNSAEPPARSTQPAQLSDNELQTFAQIYTDLQKSKSKHEAALAAAQTDEEAGKIQEDFRKRKRRDRVQARLDDGQVQFGREDDQLRSGAGRASACADPGLSSTVARRGRAARRAVQNPSAEGFDASHDSSQPGLNSAATTRRRSCTSTLYVRHAAGVLMISRPTPRAASAPMRSSSGQTRVEPVPSSTISGSSASAGSRSASVTSAGAATRQSSISRSGRRSGVP